MAENEKGARVLIVDDTPQNIQVLGTVLREQNYQINVAQNGLQALDSVEKVPPDLILLDVMMPELDGFETCKRLKANDDTKDIPVIFLTAKVETDDVVHGFELGAVDYVTKPFNATELLARVRTHLELQRLRRELEEYNTQLEQKVAERTAEVRQAHFQLQLQVRELEGRDKLAHAQMTADSLPAAYEQILEVLQEVLNVARAKIYRPDDAGSALQVVSAVGLSAPGVLQKEEDLTGEAPIAVGSDTAVSQTFADGKPRGTGGEASVPIIYGDHTLGILWLEGMQSEGADEKALLDVSWRLSRDAAILCHSIEQSQQLESGDIDVSSLLEIEE